MYQKFDSERVLNAMLRLFSWSIIKSRFFRKFNFLIAVCSVSFYFDCVHCYKIVGLFPYPARSHYTVFEVLMVELARRGHNITTYNTFPKPYPLPNYREISIKHCFSLPNILTMEQMIKIGGGFSSAKGLFQFGPKYEEISGCAPLMELLNSGEKYDLFVTETFTTEIFQLFAFKLGAPVLKFHSNIPLPWMADQLALPDNPSYLPFSYTGFTDKMNFFQRCENFLVYWFAKICYWWSEREYDDIATKIFGSGIPSISEVVKNTSIILFYSHFAFNFPRPNTPDAVEVAGLHIGKPKAIPQDIEKFINESTHGVVYFCMGSLLRGETFPEEKRNAFMYAFSKIPQRVLWKWEGDSLPGKSDNIMISKWMPQRDILAHPNVKLFISHGGLLGTSEAVYEGVPILGIPIFGDQKTNVKTIEANGAGEYLDYNEISKEVVLEKIQRLLTDPKYKENAKQLSERYRDRPMSPLDTAVYWTEYVIRHKGAPHLKSAAVELTWYQYLLLDVIAFLLFVVITALVIIYYTLKFIIKFIISLICGKSSSSKSTKKQKKN